MEDNKNSNLYNKEGVFGRTMEKIINNKSRPIWTAFTI